MDTRQDARRQGLAELQLQLANASRLLDEIEKRSLARRPIRDSSSDGAPVLTIPENAETRFAACVALGMAKLKQG
jgi:hypothetical protein